MKGIETNRLGYCWGQYSFMIFVINDFPNIEKVFLLFSGLRECERKMAILYK
jgi:hypothetical protein